MRQSVAARLAGMLPSAVLRACVGSSGRWTLDPAPYRKVLVTKSGRSGQRNHRRKNVGARGGADVRYGNSESGEHGHDGARAQAPAHPPLPTAPGK